MLNSLPESLDETYERMLCNINYHLAEDARRILTLLCFAERPLTVQELIDGVAVEINGDSSGLNHKRRLQDSHGIRDICGGFIDIYTEESYIYKEGKYEKQQEEEEEDEEAEEEEEEEDEEEEEEEEEEVEEEEEEEQEEGVEGEIGVTQTVRIAHFSVQEYLTSERIRHQKAAAFSLTSDTAHTEIAQICLAYLCDRGLSQPKLDLRILKDHPLAQYAAKFWYGHYKKTASLAREVNEFILKLFRCQNSFVTWIRLDDPDGHSDLVFRDELRSRISRSLDRIPNPIYYASLLGLNQTLRALISVSQDESEMSKQINANGGDLGNALQAASYNGHDHVIHILLDNGADISAQGGFYGHALQAASHSGHGHVIHILLDNGADINAQGGYYGHALQAASDEGHFQIVQLLLKRGANVNAQGGVYGNALQAASFNSHIQIVQLLLDNGAHVNTQGGKIYNNALQAASCNSHYEVVQLLLDNGAHVNAQGRLYNYALEGASSKGHYEVVRLLLDNGAHVNAQDRWHSNALEAASRKGYDKVVQLLLDNGAHVNAQGRLYDNALEAASCNGHDKVMQLLLDKGAVLDAKSLKKALCVAKNENYHRVVQLLRDHKAALRRKMPVSEGVK